MLLTSLDPISSTVMVKASLNSPTEPVAVISLSAM